MKLLDGYIIKKFLGTFIFMLIILSLIVVVIDISQKIDRISDNGSTLSAALVEFYPYWTVWLINTFTPVAVFVSVIYFTSRITNDTEIVAMHAGGISFFRLSKSYLIAASGIAILVLFINHVLLPFSNIKKNEYEYQYMASSKKKSENSGEKKIAAQLTNDSYLFINSYNRIRERGRGFLYQEFDEKGLTKNLFSRDINWKNEDSTYVLNGYYERVMTDSGEVLNNGSRKTIKLPFTPDELLPQAYIAETMNSFELNKFIKREKFKGSSNINGYLLEYYKRTSVAITILILTMLALSLSSRKARGGIGINLVIGIALAFIYIFIIESARVFTNKGLMSPFLAAWVGNFIFSPITLFTYLKRAKS